ncbi:MAG: hypothetical protein E6G89_16990 [Alphaproteobacteria bacterium]|nr:MAG: hypothetical protein E6G89_16990 [Alphaproteobacteria bacterium]
MSPARDNLRSTPYLSRRRLLLSAIAASTAGCVAPGTSFFDLTLPPARDTPEMAPGTGLVVTRINMIESNASAARPPVRLTINSRPSTGLASGLFSPQPGTNFYVVVLRAGSYQWRELYLANFSSGIFRNDFIFDCTDQQVTYIGDVDISLDWSSTLLSKTE